MIDFLWKADYVTENKMVIVNERSFKLLLFDMFAVEFPG